MKKYRIGYTQGTFDMFHIGHLNLIKHACELCDTLIVGVNSDELVKEYKHKTPVINEKERAEIVRNIKGVDECFVVNTLDKMNAHDLFHFEKTVEEGGKRAKRLDVGEVAVHHAALEQRTREVHRAVRFRSEYS